ncbi:MAG: PCMD domain-containing protein [Candidatus Symbiothrix sp.]|nr:PCMD domain-containing protein [Candidatus Symbiothrix sp.]
MKFQLLFITLFTLLLTSCIKDEALNPEADILALAFPENSLRTQEVEINNDYIVVYPRQNVNLRDSLITSIELSEGATYSRISNSLHNDTLFYIDVVSQSKAYTKRYSVIQVEDFPSVFEFETWVKPSMNFQYENPKEGAVQWYSSNNGIAIAWNSASKPANEYPVRKINISGNTAVELRTMVGPGKIMGGTTIPCVAGSLYLGGFNPLTGLSNPLRSTSFGIPFNSGKPVQLTGYYMYNESSEDYINPDGSRDKNKKDICAIYAILYKTDNKVHSLYGDDIDTSPNVIARAEVKPENIKTGNEFVYFAVDFDYASYPIPFSWEELANNEYKLAIVFSSSHRGQYYEGRPGNTLIIDNIELKIEL